MVYQAVQVKASDDAAGQIACLGCGDDVHRWTGAYDYVRWRPLTEIAHHG
jgi:hypothetical protein